MSVSVEVFSNNPHMQSMSLTTEIQKEKDVYFDTIHPHQGSDWKTTKKRVMTYINDAPSDKLLPKYFGSVATTTCIGMGVGGGVGFACGGPIGVGPGLGIGAAVGYVVGNFIFAGIAYKNYKKWCKANLQTDVIDKFYQLHMADPELERFVDPISLGLILNPVRDKWGNIYDRDLIEQWIDKNGGSAMDPKKNGYITKSDLQPAYDVMAKMRKAYTVLLAKEMKEKALSPEVVKGFELVCEGLTKQAKLCYQHRMKELASQLSKKQITNMKYAEEVLQLTKDLDIDNMEA